MLGRTPSGVWVDVFHGDVAHPLCSPQSYYYLAIGTAENINCCFSKYVFVVSVKLECFRSMQTRKRCGN